HEDRHAKPRPAEFSTDVETVLAGQHDIEQDQIELCFPSAPGRRISIARNFDFVALHLQIVFQPERNRRFILHHKAPAHPRPPEGLGIVNVWLRRDRRAPGFCPPCAATMCRTIASPTPVPFTLPATAALPRTNF